MRITEEQKLLKIEQFFRDLFFKMQLYTGYWRCEITPEDFDYTVAFKWSTGSIIIYGVSVNHYDGTVLTWDNPVIISGN